MALGALVKRRAAEGHALVDRATVTDFGCFAHHNAHRVVKENARANLGTRMNLDARQKARQMRDKTAQPLKAVGPAPVGASMQDEGMQPGVAGQHFPGTAGGGVAFKNALNVGAEA